MARRHAGLKLPAAAHPPDRASSRGRAVGRAARMALTVALVLVVHALALDWIARLAMTHASALRPVIDPMFTRVIAPAAPPERATQEPAAGPEPVAPATPRRPTITAITVVPEPPAQTPQPPPADKRTPEAPARKLPPADKRTPDAPAEPAQAAAPAAPAASAAASAAGSQVVASAAGDGATAPARDPAMTAQDQAQGHASDASPSTSTDATTSSAGSPASPASAVAAPARAAYATGPQDSAAAALPAQAAAGQVPGASGAPAADAASSASASASTSAGVAPAPGLDTWPADTRVNYVLDGQFRGGPLYGSARVQWQRQGPLYQTRLEIDVSLVPTRVMTSQGDVTPRGLRPRAYEETYGTNRRSVRLNDREIVMSDGRTLPRPDGVQDTASQFVELGHRFATGREKLAVGQSVSVWLARPGGLDLWVYDVTERELLRTPHYGEVEAFRLRPRAIAKPRGNITAEIWYAPSLQYLPVRIRVTMGSDAFVDLMVDTVQQR